MPLNSKKTFRTSDWMACWATVVISLVVYTLTLQPTVGLEDSGELVVASGYIVDIEAAYRFQPVVTGQKA